MNAYPLYPRRERTDLDGIWDFHFIPGESAPALGDFSPDGVVYDDVETVPGVFDATQPRAGLRGLGVYRRTFTLAREGRHLFTCGGFLLAARVFVDGVEIGRTDQPYMAVRFPFAASAGTHEVVVVCDNRFAATPMWLPNYDFYAFGGICRHADVMDLPEGAIRRAAVATLSLDGSVRVDVTFEDPAPSDGEVSLAVAFDGGQPRACKARVAGGRASLRLKVPNPTPWSPESPALHTVTVATSGDAVTERFGLRTVEARDGRILLNGAPVKLMGYNRHESDPDIGPALGPQQHLQDLRLLREMHCNFIRGCHYPQNQGFLDLCDQMGLFVWEEALGWGNQGPQLGDRVFFDHQVEAVRAMVRESINHPSVILWGFLNEGASDAPTARPLYRKLADTIREEDSTRLVTYASNRYERDVCFEFVDVMSINAYPAWYGTGCEKPREFDLIPKCFDRFEKLANQPEYSHMPLIMSEIGAAALYGCHDRVGSEWSEEYQEALIGIVVDETLKRNRYSGLALWQFCDARTYVSSIYRPRGFNNKGTLDEFRRPKMAFHTVKAKLGAKA